MPIELINLARSLDSSKQTTTSEPCSKPPQQSSITLLFTQSNLQEKLCQTQHSTRIAKMNPTELSHAFKVDIGKTKCSDNAYHVSSTCNECKQLEQDVAMKREAAEKKAEEAEHLEEEDKRAALTKVDECVRDPCTNPHHYLSGDKIHCPKDGEKELRAHEIYG